MKFRILSLLLFLCTISFGQIGPGPFFEGGLMFGISNYQGDLTTSVIELSTSKVAYGVFARYNANKYVSVKLHLYRGTLTGDDKYATDSKRKNRNLHFRSPITEFAIIPEFNIMGWDPDDVNQPFSPYVFLGVAIYNYNPQAEFEGVWYNLQSLGTEGQNLNNDAYPAPYNLTQVSMPFGAGFKYTINGNLNIGIEIGSRFTNNDYLDDISGTYVSGDELRASGPLGSLSASLSNRTAETGNFIDFKTGATRGSKAKDWYLFAGLTVSYNIFPY